MKKVQDPKTATRHQRPIPDQCPEGEFNYNGECFKINFCINPAIHNCSQGTECQLLDTFPFFQCAPLPDLCAANPCPAESACEMSNDMTEYNCVCGDGNAPTNNSCTRDPCDTAPCQTCEKCYNLADGEAICIKRAGYDHHSDECVDINECENGFANCEQHADCVNLDGKERAASNGRCDVIVNRSERSESCSRHLSVCSRLLQWMNHT